ncbi:MAG: glucose 1-dehydrogenase [Chloroflexia bacterium]|nr:glucose 1-dehydrogenase [Chloroflexia bacterium]
MLLANTVSVVTGGGSGIGRATAELFAREGSTVIVADLAGDRAEAVARGIDDAGGTAMAVAADVSTPDGVNHIFERAGSVFGTVDILVNNAGASIGNDLRTIEPDIWDRNFEIVLKSAFLCTKSALPGMIAKRKGAIVNIASVNGMLGLGEEAYSAAKAGMINLTQNTAIRYGEYQVRANCIAPGTVDTPIWKERVAVNPDVFETLAAWYPLGRVGQPQDIANAALFLVSDASSWITGAVLPVDGGLTAGLFRMAKELSPAE